MVEEIIVDVKGFEGKYRVSNYGYFLRWRVKQKDWKILKGSVDSGGYIYACLMLPKKRDPEKPNSARKFWWMQRLVAMHFIPNPHNHRDVNHIDGDRKNNHVSNLEWVSRRENVSHGLRMKGFKGMIGVKKTPHSTYAAYYTIGVKTIYLGEYATPELAHQKYIEAITSINSCNKYALSTSQSPSH